MVNRVGALIAVTTLSLACLPGCYGGSDQNKTVQGLQEENKVLREQISTLQTQIGQLKAESEANKATAGKEFEDRLAKARLLHEEKVKHLESQNARLMLELGSIRQEKLTLQEMLDSRPRVQDASQTRFGIERTVWMVLVVLPLVVLLMVASKCHNLRGQLNVLVVQKASELRRLERVP